MENLLPAQFWRCCEPDEKLPLQLVDYHMRQLSFDWQETFDLQAGMTTDVGDRSKLTEQYKRVKWNLD